MLRLPTSDAMAADLLQAHGMLSDIIHGARAAYARGFAEDDIVERTDDERAAIRRVAEIEAWLTTAEARSALLGGAAEDGEALLRFIEERTATSITDRDLLASAAALRLSEHQEL